MTVGCKVTAGAIPVRVHQFKNERLRLSRYAQDTDVPVERSKAQLEALLRNHGAQGFASGWTVKEDRIEFVWNDVQIRFILPRPNRKEHEATATGLLRSKAQVELSIAKADRQRWRALFLVVRAKLEAVEAGIAIFEQEFLGFIVTPNNQTVGDMLVPRIQAGEMKSGRLLDAPKEVRRG